MSAWVPVLTTIGGVLVGYLFDRWREGRFWRRAFERLGPTGRIANVTPPTVTELRQPDWGSFLVDCPHSFGACMSQAALDEHLRVRHGDS